MRKILLTESQAKLILEEIDKNTGDKQGDW